MISQSWKSVFQSRHDSTRWSISSVLSVDFISCEGKSMCIIKVYNIHKCLCVLGSFEVFFFPSLTPSASHCIIFRLWTVSFLCSPTGHLRRIRVCDSCRSGKTLSVNLARSHSNLATWFQRNDTISIQSQLHSILCGVWMSVFLPRTKLRQHLPTSTVKVSFLGGLLPIFCWALLP